MDDTKKMLRAVINNQSSLKGELLDEIGKLRKGMNAGFEEQKKESRRVETNLTKRIDRVGKSLAYLEDDTPTIDEFGRLEERVKQLEQTAAPA
jgi:hypothetical protein